MKEITRTRSHKHKFVEDNNFLYRKHLFIKKKQAKKKNIYLYQMEVCCKWKKQSKAQKFLVRLDTPAENMKVPK